MTISIVKTSDQSTDKEATDLKVCICRLKAHLDAKGGPRKKKKKRVRRNADGKIWCSSVGLKINMFPSKGIQQNDYLIDVYQTTKHKLDYQLSTFCFYQINSQLFETASHNFSLLVQILETALHNFYLQILLPDMKLCTILYILLRDRREHFLERLTHIEYTIFVCFLQTVFMLVTLTSVLR